MDFDDLQVQEEMQVSRVDARAERLIMAEEVKRAHERAVCEEIDRKRQRQTVKEVLLALLVIAAAYVVMRIWAAPELAMSLESWLARCLS
jgi:hypothetical protein